MKYTELFSSVDLFLICDVHEVRYIFSLLYF